MNIYDRVGGRDRDCNLDLDLDIDIDFQVLRLQHRLFMFSMFILDVYFGCYILGLVDRRHAD